MVAGNRRLTKSQREEVSDARLLLEAAAHNSSIAAKVQGDLSDDQEQALRNAASQAAQAAAALRRVVKDL
jgi:hypothetical protein